jgi:hypothetical protein
MRFSDIVEIRGLPLIREGDAGHEAPRPNFAGLDLGRLRIAALQRSRLLANALPDALFRYRSNSIAFRSSEKAM